jgi:branched-chain amino acid transport system permease protein
VTLSQRLLSERRFTIPALIVVGIGALAFPFVFSIYQTNIMITALIYVMLGLGLNIVVGVAGLLDLGYVAFYAVGAYSYALLNYHFGLGFWTVLGIGGAMAAMFGIILGFPVLRLRGDYLAIVTLGFGEIIRLILENWNEFSFGPSGIANIPRPGLFRHRFEYRTGDHLRLFPDDRHEPVYHFCGQPAAGFEDRKGLDRPARRRSRLPGHGHRQT